MIAIVRGKLPDEIERLALIGWHCYPTSRSSRAALWKGGHLSATTDLDLLAAWAFEHPGCNWRVLLGPSRIFALDIDKAGEDHDFDGLASWHALLQRPEHALPRRDDGRAALPVARSGGGGLLVVFQHRGEKIVGRSGYLAPGIDPLRGMQSITVPPSMHLRTRQPYRWLAAPWDVAPPPAPDWLLERLAPAEPAELERRDVSAGSEMWALRCSDSAVWRVYQAKEGQRNDTLNKEAYWLSTLCSAGLLDETDCLHRLFSAGRHIGLPDPEIRSTLFSAFTAGRLNPYRKK